MSTMPSFYLDPGDFRSDSCICTAKISPTSPSFLSHHMSVLFICFEDVFIFYPTCMAVLPAVHCQYTVVCDVPADCNRVPNVLELELQSRVSYPVGSGN